MTNNDIIDKLLMGTNETHKVTIKVDDDDLNIELRPLTSGELTKLKSIEKEPYTMNIGVNSQGKRTKTSVDDTANMTIGMGEFTEAQAEAMYTAVAWSMDTSVDTVKNFKTGIPELIFKHVIDISNLTDEDLTVLKQFR